MENSIATRSKIDTVFDLAERGDPRSAVLAAVELVLAAAVHDGLPQRIADLLKEDFDRAEKRLPPN